MPGNKENNSPEKRAWRLRLLAIHATVIAVRSTIKVFMAVLLFDAIEELWVIPAFYSVTFIASTALFAISGRWIAGGRGYAVFVSGILLHSFFCVVTGTLRMNAPTTFAILAISYGIATGLYWLPYNMLKLAVPASWRPAYFANEKAVEVAVSSTTPILVGWLLSNSEGVTGVFSVLAGFTFAGIILSSVFRSTTTYNAPFRLRTEFASWSAQHGARVGNEVVFLCGFTVLGALEVCCIMMLYSVVDNVFIVGIAAGTAPLVSCAVSLLTHRLRGMRQHKTAAAIAIAVVAAAIVPVLVDVNTVTTLLFYSAFALAAPVVSIFQFIASFDAVGDGDGKVERMVIREVFVNSGRVLSYGVLLIAGSLTTSLAALQFAVAVYFTVLTAIVMRFVTGAYDVEDERPAAKP